MSPAVIALLALLAIGVALLTNVAFQTRQIARKMSERVGAVDRYVDIGVIIHCVVADPDGEELVEGKPRLRIVDTKAYGGIVDTALVRPKIVEPSRLPRVWYASPDQFAALKHNDPAQLGQLVYGSEGAGKTRLLAMWHYVRWVKALGERREGGQTAPTTTRLKMVRDEMLSIFAPAWFTYSSSEDTFTMCDGTTIKLVSTYRQSAAQGSPIQGFNWSWCGRDEAQDQIDVHEDIESRGRSAKDGHYWQLATATAKDDPHWRTLRSVLLSSGQWVKRDLSIFRSPFVTAQFLATKRASMTDREFRRRYGNPETGLVEDLAPELALYFGWNRQRCLVTIKHGRLTRVLDDATSASHILLRSDLPMTSQALARKIDIGFSLLAGHDPGSLKGATIYLDAYALRGTGDYVWVVRGERMHRRQTTEQSARDILKDAERMQRRVHVRAQPVGQSEDKPSEDLYRIFRRVGLDVRAAQYKKDGTGTGVIKKDDRIELLNWLFEKGRLFVECDDLGRPVAPNLVTALESMERDEKGRAEWERKDGDDLSDCPAALGYALWPFEKSAASGLQADIRKGLA